MLLQHHSLALRESELDLEQWLRLHIYIMSDTLLDALLHNWFYIGLGLLCPFSDEKRGSLDLVLVFKLLAQVSKAHQVGTPIISQFFGYVPFCPG